MIKGGRHITIIVPVYGDWPSLSECIESLIEYTSPSKHTVLLINDCGPEADELELRIRKAIKGYKHFKYYRNKKNLGFLKNCNNAVENLDKTSNNVLLLNSDTKVTAGALEELENVLDSNKQIGAVSPRSNNATITTVPLRAMKQKGVEPKRSYALFKKINRQFPRTSVVPTAHGFCILIRRSLIEKYGLFDPAFGKGYGEEVDFCQRIRGQGYICVLANRAFVFHQEARSFSLEKKAKLLETNNKIIRARYPAYQKEVRDYIETALRRENKIEGKRTNISASTIIRNYRGVRKKIISKFIG